MGWKKQLRGAKAVERAEICLDAAHEVADLIRAARSPLVSMAAEDASRPAAEAGFSLGNTAGVATPDRLRAASNAIREEALNRAWASWRAFASSYRQIGYFDSAIERSIPTDFPENDAWPASTDRPRGAVLCDLEAETFPKMGLIGKVSG
jgi:hypothetical protein